MFAVERLPAISDRPHNYLVGQIPGGFNIKKPLGTVGLGLSAKFHGNRPSRFTFSAGEAFTDKHRSINRQRIVWNKDAIASA